MRTKVTLATEKDIAEITHFIRLEYVFCKDWPDNVLQPWIKVFCSLGFCVIGRELIEDSYISITGHITSLLLGRPISCIKRVKEETFYYDHSGAIFFIDLVIMKNNAVGLVMKDMMVTSVGMKDFLAFTRDYGNLDKVHVWRLEKILKYYAIRK